MIPRVSKTSGPKKWADAADWIQHVTAIGKSRDVVWIFEDNKAAGYGMFRQQEESP